jgi:CheY-like chemotaxis protein/nitrogen-specific signal transduction histidine kinase
LTIILRRGFILSIFKKSKTDEINALRAELAEVKAQAESAKRVNRNARTFFASVSHEIRTPVNAVMGMAELLSVDAPAAEQLEKIRTIKTYSNILLGLIDDLLDFSRIEQGSFELRPEHYYFPGLLENITSAARYNAQLKGLEFTTEFPEEIPPYIFGDSAKLNRALTNLLSNAVKFTEKGSVTLSLTIEDGMQKFAVRDTGIGIRPEDCSRLFDVFEQLKERRSKGLAGLGLGLTITDNIVRVMNGKLTVESIYGFGSVFRIEIPYEAGCGEQAESGADDGSYVYATDANVLIVDDIDVNLSVGIGFLKLHGIQPDTATSAKEAIKKVCEKDYDIVLMDHMMPDTDGGKASEIIRSFGGRYEKSDNPTNLKIIALTASVSPETKVLMLNKGMDDFLPKPVTKQALNRILMKWLPADKYEMAERAGSEADATETLPDGEPLFAELAEKIPELNIELGFRRSGGTTEAFRNSLKLLCRRIPRSIEKLEKCLNTGGRLRDFKVEAHGMKGALAINGLESLSERAYELELAAEAENAELCMKKLPEFKARLDGLKLSLSEIFSEGAEDSEEKTQGDSETLGQIISGLIIDIERFDRAAALEQIRSTRGFNFGDGDELLKAIKADLEDYDYDAAMEKLQNFNNNGGKYEQG